MKESLNQPSKPETIFIHLTDEEGALGNRKTLSKVDKDKKGIEEPYIFEEPLKGMQTVDFLEKTPDNKIHELGFCTFKIYEKPVPFVYLSWTVKENDPLAKEVIPEDTTVGDKIIQKLNSIIEEKKLFGVLGSIIPKGTSAYSLYERNGWKELREDAGTVWMGYNLPENLAPEQIAEIIKETKADDPYFASHGG